MQNRILIAVLVTMVLMWMMTMGIISQVAPVPEGFPFFRLPLVLTELKQDSVKVHRSNIVRLTMLMAVPEGSTDVVNPAGHTVVWDAIMRANVQAEIDGHYSRLAALGDGAWTYTYTHTP